MYSFWEVHSSECTLECSFFIGTLECTLSECTSLEKVHSKGVNIYVYLNLILVTRHMLRRATPTLRPLLSRVARGITYRVTVRTGDFRGAGTQANVTMQLFGSRGKSPEVPLSAETLQSSESNSIFAQIRAKMEDMEKMESIDGLHGVQSRKTPGVFERNSHQVFALDVPRDLGELKSVAIGHDSEGLGSGWYLESVLVESEDAVVDDDETLMAASFRCGKWLGEPDSGSGGVGGPTTRVLLRSAATGGSDFGGEREMSRSALIAGGPGLKLCGGAMATPHADKVRHGGERGVNHRDLGHAGDDAYFVGGEKAMGVADGVGQWSEKGIDSGEYSRKLFKVRVSNVRVFLEAESAAVPCTSQVGQRNHRSSSSSLIALASTTQKL